MSHEFPNPEDFPGDINPPYEGEDPNDDADFDGVMNTRQPADGFPDSEIVPTHDRMGGSYSSSHSDTNADRDVHDMPPVGDLSAKAGLNMSGRDAAEISSPIGESLHGPSNEQHRFVGDLHPEGLAMTYELLTESRRANTEYSGESSLAVQPGTILLSRSAVTILGPVIKAPMLGQRAEKLHPRDYHAFSDGIEYGEAVLAETGELPHYPVTSLPESGILIASGSQYDNLSRAVAGTVMATAVQWITPRVEQGTDGATTLEFNVTQGYDRPDIQQQGGMNAMVVDMATDRALHAISVSRNHIPRFNGPMAAIGSAAVLHTAKETGQTPQYIEDMLTNGYFTGDPQMLRVMQEVFGDGGMEILLSLTGNENYDEVAETAQALQLGHARRYVDNWAAGQHMNVYEWR